MKRKVILLTALFVLSVLAVIPFVWDSNIPVLNPKGLIALKERDLLIAAVLLMAIVVIPVFILTGWISWRYKEGHKGKYEPEWDKNSLIEWVWWGVPFIIIAILGWITWTSSHELDPYKPLEHEKKPMTIQVVALQWKWLFLYPEQKIATVNYVQFPEKTPISFDITADAPMNSFWIPQLGSQIYAMPGMKTKLQLIADESGEFRGSSSNISGQGFSGMTFMAKASSQEEFDAWAESVSKSPQVLSWEEYQELVKPTSYVPPACYALKDTGLYEQIVMKYMAPSMEREKEKP